MLVNKRKAKGDSYEKVRESQNKIENDVLLCDAEPEINNERKTPTKNTFSYVDLSLDSITKSISNLTAKVMAIKTSSWAHYTALAGVSTVLGLNK